MKMRRQTKKKAKNHQQSEKYTRKWEHYLTLLSLSLFSTIVELHSKQEIAKNFGEEADKRRKNRNIG